MTKTKLSRKQTAKKVYSAFSTALIITACIGFSALAAGDGGDPAVKAINNLTGVICTIVSAIGVIIAVWGVVQLGMSFSSHDASARNQSFLTIAGGIIVAVAPQLLKSILSGTGVDTSAIPATGGGIFTVPSYYFNVLLSLIL